LHRQRLGLGNGNLQRLSSESGGEHHSLIIAVGQIRESDRAITGGGKDSDSSVVAAAINRHLHSGHTLAGWALHNEFQVTSEQGAATQETEKENANAGQLSSSRERGWIKVRAGLLTCELRCGHRDNNGGLPVCTVAVRQTARLQLRGSAGFTPASQFRASGGTREPIVE
jgi:hypothetical protein